MDSGKVRGVEHAEQEYDALRSEQHEGVRSIITMHDEQDDEQSVGDPAFVELQLIDLTHVLPSSSW